MDCKERQGATLIEVLVAIFVMGIGLLALLTLFPLGVLSMANAIQQERCAQASRVATATAQFQNVRNDSWVLYPNGVPQSPDFFMNPGWAAVPAPVGGFASADPDGPSYPIFVDPVGYNLSAGYPSSQNWLSMTAANTIRRRSVSFVQNYPTALTSCAYRWFSLLDELPFGPDGFPPQIAAGTFDTRNTRYSWAYMLKRPRTADHSVVDLTVAVFKDRALAESSGTLNEFLYQSTGSPTDEVAMDPVANTITISVISNIIPPAKVGEWLLDASYVPSATNSSAATVNGYFYKIVGITENAPPPGYTASFTYEVLQPLRNFPATGLPTSVPPGKAWQKILYLEGLTEVYEKGPGKLP